MKMEINIRIINDNGTEVIKPIETNTEIPGFEEYTGADNFREVFNRCEQSVLKIRNASAEAAIEDYLTELSKKKLLQRQKS
jgi:hypothetical protein